MKKEKYENPVCNIIVLEIEDVITLSLGGSNDKIDYGISTASEEEF